VAVRPGFSASEMRRRREAFGRELDRGGLSYALVYGANRSGSAVPWLTGWPVTREALVVVAPDEDDDVLLVSFFNHVPQARRLSATRVEWAGPHAVVTALDLMAARSRLPDRIGVVGALPFDQYRILAGQISGARAGDLAAAAAIIGRAGFSTIDDVVHGFGGGYLPPVVPGPGRPLRAPDFTLAAGMTLVVQPNVVTRDGHAGVQIGELLLVTEHGPQRLHAYPRGLQQAG
jgi:hypothetical protein